MKSLIQRFWSDEEGAAAIEYALIAALVGVGIAAGATELGTDLSSFFKLLADKLPTTI
jgi:pilus assembly protein Flp/PilA